MDRETIRKKYPLSDEQKLLLSQKYYETDLTIKQILKDFGLKGLNSSQITYLFDNIETNIKCEYCKVIMEQEPPTRTDGNKDTFCPQCKHILYRSSYRQCCCENCQKKKQIEKEKKEQQTKNAIYNLLNRDHDKTAYNAEDLTSWDKLLLGSLITFAMDEELKYIQPLEDCERCFFPGRDKSIEIIEKLYDDGLIILGNRYRTSSFTFDEKNNVSFYLNKVFYEVWVDDSDICKKLLNPNQFLNDDQILSFWRDFNKGEAIFYLLSEFENLRIKSFSPGKKTEELFAAMAEKLSLSQIFRMIRYITDKTAKEVMTGDKYYQHIANSTITRLESHFYRALHENYSLYNVKYENDLSMVTTYFYNKILNMGDSAFYSVPNIAMEKYIILREN